MLLCFGENPAVLEVAPESQRNVVLSRLSHVFISASFSSTPLTHTHTHMHTHTHTHTHTRTREAWRTGVPGKGVAGRQGRSHMKPCSLTSDAGRSPQGSGCRCWTRLRCWVWATNLHAPWREHRLPCGIRCPLPREVTCILKQCRQGGGGSDVWGVACPGHGCFCPDPWFTWGSSTPDTARWTWGHLEFCRMFPSQGWGSQSSLLCYQDLADAFSWVASGFHFLKVNCNFIFVGFISLWEWI